MAVVPSAPRARRAIGVSVLVGLVVALCVVAIGFSIIAIPLYMLARVEPGSGIDRPVIRDGLLYVAIPVGLVLGAVVGTLVGVWYGRGGRMPEPPPPAE
jgi:hypothetical protein